MHTGTDMFLDQLQNGADICDRLCACRALRALLLYLVYMYICVSKHAHTCKCIRLDMYILLRKMHIFYCICIYWCMQGPSCSPPLLRIHIYLRIRIRTHVYMYMFTRIHTNVYIYFAHERLSVLSSYIWYIFISVYIHMYVHACVYMYTYINIYTCIYVCLRSEGSSCSPPVCGKCVHLFKYRCKNTHMYIYTHI